jgi:acyl carrier protein
MAVWSSQFEDALRMHSKFLSDDTVIDPDLSLRELGIDSLEIAELIALVEDEFRLEIPLERLTPEWFETPRTIWQLLCSVEPGLRAAEVGD